MQNRLVSGLGWTTISSICRNIVNLLQIAVLTRFLDKSDFGLIAIAQLFVSFTTLFLDMGISAGILYKQKISRKEYSSLFWLNIIFGIALTIILFFVTPLITQSYHSDDLNNVVRLLCFTIFFNAFGTQQRTYCQKKSYFKRLAIIEIGSYLLILTAAILFAVLGFGVYSLALSTLVGTIVLNLTHFVIALIKDSRLSFHFSFSEVIPYIKLGIYQVGASILDFLTRELDTLIISSTLGLDFLGVYNIAKRVPVAIYSFIQPIISRVITPMFAEINNDIQLVRSNFLISTKFLSWISFPMYALLAISSPSVISMLFGSSYIEGSSIMMAFCLVYAFNGVLGLSGALQVAMGRTDLGLIWTIYLISVTAIVYLFTSKISVILFIISICILALINVWACWFIQFRQLVQITFKDYISSLIRACVISFICVTPLLLWNNQLHTFLSIISVLIFCVLYLFIFCKSKEGAIVLEFAHKNQMPELFITSLNKIRNFPTFKF